LRNNKGPLTKTFGVDVAGGVAKATAAALYDGHAQLVECDDLEAFMRMRATLESNEALMFGVTGHASIRITTKKALRDKPAQNAGKVARDGDSVHYAKAPGILMLDHDAEHLPQAYDRDAFRDALLTAVPELQLAPMAWATSASSHIVNSETGEEVQGLRGQRGYIPVLDATDIPRVGRIIYERLWAAGIGTFIVSKSGALLDRNLVDASAWQAERIDFAAGAKCTAPLEQRAPPWHIWPDPMGDTLPWDSHQWLEDLTAEQREAAAANRAAARAAVAGEAKTAREGYVEERAQALVAERGVDIDEARALVRRAVEQQLLFADFVLHPEEGEPVTVGQVLDDPKRWHGTRFADPLEPTYRNDRRIAWINLYSGGRPYLFSWAHGLDQRYELVRQPAQLRVQPGENARLTDECLRIMRERGDMYDFGSHDIARVADGKVIPVTRGYMLDYLGRHVRFTRHDPRAKKGEDPNKPTGCPDKVANAVVDRTGERDLPKLRGVITAPTLRADGSVFDTPGFDKATGLLYVSDDPSPPRVPSSPKRAAVEAALRELMEPVQEFPFADPESRSVALAALLTACVRRCLPTAPAFAFDAPAPGTGKSLLAKAVLALGGHRPASHKPPPSDEECGKVLFAALRGGDGAIFFDNFATPIGGPAIDHFLTTEEYAGRILGSSVNQPSLPNGALMLFTGNNISLMGDTCRRVLTCRLDARVEHPSRRSFAFDPEQFVRARRPRLVHAALTLLRGYQAAGAEPKGRPLGSFEAWDALVRQTVCWLADTQSEFELGDPNVTTERSDIADDGKGQLAAVLTAWRDAFGDEPRTAAQALDFAQGGDDFVTSGTSVALSKAVQGLARHASDTITAKRLGQWLKANKDKVACDCRFEGFVDRVGVTQWVARAIDAGIAGIAGMSSRPLKYQSTRPLA
jgi:hypothetical protein